MFFRWGRASRVEFLPVVGGGLVHQQTCRPVRVELFGVWVGEKLLLNTLLGFEATGLQSRQRWLLGGCCRPMLWWWGVLFDLWIVVASIKPHDCVGAEALWVFCFFGVWFVVV